MKLIAKLAIRELVNSKKFVSFFVFNLSLGILGFLILHSFKTSVNESIGKRAKFLLAADISITSRKDLDEKQKEKIDRYLDPYLKDYSFVNEVYSMGQGDGVVKRSRLIQIKMITDSFPLYGEVKLKSEFSNQNSPKTKKDKNKKLKDNKITWISKELAHQLKLSIGSKLKLGNLTFVVDDIIEEDSTTSSRGISLAPKLYIHHHYQQQLGLVSQGSVANYSHLFQLNKLGLENIKEIQKEILKLLDDNAFKVLLPENSSEQVGRVLNYLSDYLGLVSLVAIFLSAIGAGFLFQNFFFKRVVDIAILKSLGLTISNIYQIFYFQICLLGSLAILASGAISAVVLPLGSHYLSKFLSVPVKLAVGVDSIIISFVISIIFILFICFPIIQKLIHKRTSDLFGGEYGLEWKFEKKDLIKFIPLLITVFLLSIWQAHSIAIGSVFACVLILSSLFFFSIVPFVLKIINKAFSKNKEISASIAGLESGLAIRFLSRESIATTLTFLSIALGVMLLSIISQLEVSLNKELLGDKVKKPSLFMFDIQPEQKDDLVQFSKEHSIPLDNLTPMVRARISKVNGESFDRLKEKEFQTREDEQRLRFRNRGVNLTYSNKLNSTQKLIDGEGFKSVYNGEGLFEISLEARYAKRISAQIGSTITFDILGVEFKGEVTSLRSVRWASFRPNFFITLQEGVVEDAPQSYLGVIGSLSQKDQLDFQDKIVEKFPNISMINVTDLLEKISTIFYSMSLAIKAMAYLCILVGLFVVFGIIQNQLRKKQYDILLLKSFGMSKFEITKIFIIQFTLISVIATFFGSTLSLLVGNILSQAFFDGVWAIDWFYLFLIHGVICVLSILLVFFSTSGVYKIPVRSLLE